MSQVQELLLPSRELIRLYKILMKNYGPQGWWPIRSRRIDAGAPVIDTIGFNSGGYHPGGRYKPEREEILEIAAGAILTQNTNWNNAAAAVDSLLAADLLSADALLAVDTQLLAEKIRSSGYFNQKALKLKAVARFIKDCGARIPVRSELLSVRGVGPETADSILLYAYGEPVFVIDAYTRRIISRYTGIMETETADYGELQRAFEEAFPGDVISMQEYHALLVIHAKRYCSKDSCCAGCPLEQGCHGSKVRQRKMSGAVSAGTWFKHNL